VVPEEIALSPNHGKHQGRKWRFIDKESKGMEFNLCWIPEWDTVPI